MRFAIYSRDTAIRISSVLRFIRNKPFVKIPSWDKVMDKVMGLAASRIILPAFPILDFQIWPYPVHVLNLVHVSMYILQYLLVYLFWCWSLAVLQYYSCSALYLLY
jgi:hypothetical protein